MTPYAKQSIINAFGFPPARLDVIQYNASLPRSNLFLSLRPVRDPHDALESIKLALDIDFDDPSIDCPERVPLSIIYLDAKALCRRVKQLLLLWISQSRASHLKGIVAIYHADCSENSRGNVYQGIQNGTIRLVIATECLGMVSI